MKIAVAGTGYVGLSIATLLAQHNHVTAVDVIPEKVEKINHRISPIHHLPKMQAISQIIDNINREAIFTFLLIILSNTRGCSLYIIILGSKVEHVVIEQRLDAL